MTPEDVSYALGLIDAYVDQIEDWESTGKYDQHAKEFFDFVKEYGASVGKVVKIIQSATGKAPIQIKNKGEAQEIRELLRRTLSSEFLGRRLPSDRNNSGEWVEENVRFMFDENDPERKDPYDDYK